MLRQPDGWRLAVVSRRSSRLRAMARNQCRLSWILQEPRTAWWPGVAAVLRGNPVPCRRCDPIMIRLCRLGQIPSGSTLLGVLRGFHCPTAMGFDHSLVQLRQVAFQRQGHGPRPRWTCRPLGARSRQPRLLRPSTNQCRGWHGLGIVRQLQERLQTGQLLVTEQPGLDVDHQGHGFQARQRPPILSAGTTG